MNEYTDSGDEQNENGPDLILTAEGQRSELITAADALTRAVLRVRTLLVQYRPAQAKALTRALAAVDAQQRVIRDLLAAEVNE